MVSPINNLLKTDKTPYKTSFQTLRQMAMIFIQFCKFSKILSIRSNLELIKESNQPSQKNFYWQCNLLLKQDKLYKSTAEILFLGWNKNANSCQIHNIKSLAVGGGTDCPYQRYTMPNWQPKSEDYNVWPNLYRAIFGKCRYTSLELAVQLAILKANLIGNYPTSNPVGLAGVRAIKKCHQLWQCQTYS